MGRAVPQCWKCGSDLGDAPLPLGREAKCKSCHAHLHCCRICIFFDKSLSKQCKEPIAEEVKDKTRSNFCGYLQINPDAYQEKDSDAASTPQTELEALFGLESSNETPESDQALNKLNDLFGKDK
jgi:hypothetical protein